MLRSFSTVSSGIMLSRCFGFVREILLSHYYGASLLTDMFVLATRLPRFFHSLIEQGGLNAAFIPQYTAVLQIDQIKARIFSGRILFYTLLLILMLVVLVELTMPTVLGLLVPGLKNDPNFLTSTVPLARLGFPYLIFAGAAGVLACVLAAHQRFLSNALAPAVSNILLICALILYAPSHTDSVTYLVTIFLITGICHMLLVLGQTLAVRVMPSFAKIRFSKRVKRTLANSLPGLMTTGATQINGFVVTFMASLLPHGAISIFFYTERLAQLPVALIGISLYTVLLPSFSRKNLIEIDLQNRAINLALVLCLPCSVGFFFLGEPIVTAIYVRGAFSAELAHIIASLLRIFAFGVPVMIISRTLIAQYHAKKSYAAPLRFTVYALIINIVVAAFTLPWLQYEAIILASVVSAWVQFICLWWGLKDIRKKLFINMLITTARLLPGLILLCGCCIWALGWLDYLQHLKLIAALLAFILVCGLVFLFYGFRICKVNISN